MQPKVTAAVLGLVLTIGGVGGLAYGVLRMSATPNGGDCVGDECLADPWILAFPLGIVAVVIGLIIASWAIGSLRAESGSSTPLRAFGFMTGLGAVFLVMGVVFLGGSGGDDSGALLFVGALFGVMGLAFIGIDVLRFRGELRKDRLRVSGLKGTAKVVDVRDTGVTVNNSPMVNFDLEVTLPGQAPFRTHKRSVISRLSVGALTPGATIPVLADPNKPQSIVLDWEAGVASPVGADGSTAPAFNAWFPQGAAFQGAGGAVNAQVLRSVSQALARAAERAEHGGGGVAQTPAGLVVDGGTTVMVNGRQVPPDEVAGTLADLPGMLAAAFGSGGAASVIGAGATPGATPSVPGVPIPASVPALPAGPVAPDLGLTAAPGADALPGRVSLDTITDTGVDVAGNRLYTFDLTVSVAGRAPYQVKHAATVPKAQVPRLLRGASFPAQIDPAQPNQISIAWDR
jgi:hypothetical protein